MKLKKQALIVLSFATIASFSQKQPKHTYLKSLKGTITNHVVTLNTTFVSCKTLSTDNHLTSSFEDLKIHPNPIKDDYLNLTIPKTYKKVTVNIIDITGKFIKREIITQRASKIFIGNLSKGIYILQTDLEKGKTNLKFIKE